MSKTYVCSKQTFFFVDILREIFYVYLFICIGFMILLITYFFTSLSLINALRFNRLGDNVTVNRILRNSVSCNNL